MPRSRGLVFAALCAGVVLLTAGYVAVTRRSDPVAPSAPAPVDPAALADALKRPHLVVRSTALDTSYGQVSVLPLDDSSGTRLPTPLSCERVYFAAGRGVCLTADRGMVTTYYAVLFDGHYQPQQRIGLTGVPSRARVAPDGSRVAFTYFVRGDSYAAGGFSTRSVLVEGDRTDLVDVEQFSVLSADGQPFKAVDFNFWGITFARRPDTFYATLSTGGRMYLVEGNAATRSARVIRDGIECPSLSPDNRRVAFKRRMPGIQLLWRIFVVDLSTGQETMLAEDRSVDDQVEWLDDNTILYAIPNGARQARAAMSIWAVPADGTGAPRLVVENADSPAVVRP